jgi:hypothetical protein
VLALILFLGKGERDYVVAIQDWRGDTVTGLGEPSDRLKYSNCQSASH